MLKYTQTENILFEIVIIFHYFYSILNQIHAALVRIKYFFQI